MSVKLTTKLLKAIKTKQRPDAVDMDTWVVAVMERLNGIADSIRILDDQIEAEHKRHKNALAAIESKKQKVFDTCDHLDTTYHGDPSGGGDSTTICNICGFRDVEKEYRRS